MGLAKKEQKRIEQAVKEAEKNNEGEIVPVFLPVSDLYPAAHFRLSLLLAAITPFVAYFLPYLEISSLWYVTLPFPAAIIGYLLAFIPFFKRLFSTQGEFKEEVHQKALEVFFEQELHATKNRAVIMLLVSRLERRFEVIADVGINEKVEKETWDHVVSRFFRHQHQYPKKERSKRAVDGLISSIQECGQILDKHFPLATEGAREQETGKGREENGASQDDSAVSNSVVTE